MIHLNALMDEALVAHGQNDLKTARNIYEVILQQAPNSIGAAINLSVILLRNQELESALKLLVPFANEKAPPELWFNLGLCHTRLNNAKSAQIAFENAITLKPSFHEAKFELSKFADYENAVLLVSEAIKLAPTKDEYWVAFAVLLSKQGALNDAANLLLQAFNAGVKSAKILIQLGLTYWNLNELEKAEEAFSAVLSFEPNNPEALWQLALVRLKKGDFTNGWNGLWSRFHPDKDGGISFPNVNVPVWDGSCVERLMVVGEQGFGDNIQFARFIPGLNANTIYFVPRKELIPLFEASEKIANFATIVNADKLPEFDAWIPIMELAQFCNATDKTVPLTDGYLPKNVNPKNSPFKIGLVWQGNPSIARLDTLRSLTLKEFEPLFSLQGIQFVSLQQGFGKEQLMPYTDIVQDGGYFSDFLETSKVIDKLDLVITIDSSVAHLSAAMNKPTWILLPYVSCWRWGLSAKKSYWYDSVTLFRQSAPNDWQSVISEVKEALTSNLLK